MSQLALGLIETVGLAAGIEAADTAVKSADVKLLGYELTNGGEYVGMVTIKFVGDVSAVKAAVDAGAAAAERVTEVWSVDVIPRPHVELEQLIETEETVGLGDKTEVSESESIEKINEDDEKTPKLAEEATNDIEDEVEVEDSDTEIEVEVEVDGIDEAVENESKANIKDEKEDTENKATDEVEKEVQEEDRVEETEIVEVDETIEEDEELDEQDKEKTAMEEVDKEESDGEVIDKEDDEVIEIDQEETEEQEEEEVCNLCDDPDCPRRKGDLHVDCIHYDEIKE